MGTYEKRPCAKGCKKMLDPRGAHKHERTCGGESGTQKRSYRRRTPKAVRKSKITNRKSHIEERCLFCDAGSADRALAQELVARMIRGGMSYEASHAMVRDLLAQVRR